MSFFPRVFYIIDLERDRHGEQSAVVVTLPFGSRAIRHSLDQVERRIGKGAVYFVHVPSLPLGSVHLRQDATDDFRRYPYFLQSNGDGATIQNLEDFNNKAFTWQGRAFTQRLLGQARLTHPLNIPRDSRFKRVRRLLTYR